MKVLIALFTILISHHASATRLCDMNEDVQAIQYIAEGVSLQTVLESNAQMGAVLVKSCNLKSGALVLVTRWPDDSLLGQIFPE